MRIALVHDWLTGMRGGEKVLEVLCERFPEADVFTLVHVAGSVSGTIERHRIRTSFVQRLPGSRRYYRYYLRPEGARHLCYCLTPMRYAWDQFDAYFGRERIGRIGSAVMRPVMNRLARWDRATANRVDRYVAISHYVAGRIRRYYNREASVVYPPVDTDFFCPDDSASERYALVVSALVPYKRIDVAIEACARVGVPLKIVGDGPERPSLQRRFGARAEFLGRRSNEDVLELYRRAAVVLLPGEEDFGIVPVEAQACGRPVVALGRGGATETVRPGETGLLVEDTSVESFAESVDAALRHSFDRTVIRRHAERFGRVRFGDEMEALVRAPWAAGDFR
jgi:glycosyltransferase involved in cell wall biosynthesis